VLVTAVFVESQSEASTTRGIGVTVVNPGMIDR